LLIGIFVIIITDVNFGARISVGETRSAAEEQFLFIFLLQLVDLHRNLQK